MKFLDIDLVKAKCEDSDVCVRVVLDDNNLSKFSMGVLYSCEKGYSNYVLEYNPRNFVSHVSVEKIACRVSDQVKALVRDHGLNIYVKGFTRCIFENFFLPKDLKFEYSSKILYLDSDFDEDFEKDMSCMDCLYHSSCRGIFEMQKNKIKPSPLHSNVALSNYYEYDFDSFFNSDLRELSEMCLNDFRHDVNHGSKRLIFREKVSEGSDSFKEGFFYRIFNLKYNFEDLFSFLINVYGEKILDLKPFLIKSGVIVLGFEVLSDDTLRKRIYFSTEDFDSSELENLFQVLEFSDYENYDKIDGIYLDLTYDDMIGVNEIILRFDKISIFDLKNHFKNFPLENKRVFFKFLNSFIRDINNVYIKEEFESGFLVSKKCEVFVKDNNLKIKHLGILFGYKLGFLTDKDVRSISIELNEFTSEKVIFYYSLKLPERIEEFDYSLNYDYNS